MKFEAGSPRSGGICPSRRYSLYHCPYPRKRSSMMNAAPAAPIEFDARAEGPLADVRVLDLSRLVAGNMLSLQLADFGADVIKVEPHDGDPLRDWRDGGRQLHWKTYARNKRSIVLNLRQAAARDALLRLLGRADVFIENYRPGT